MTGYQPVYVDFKEFILLFAFDVAVLESGDRMSARSQKAKSDYTGVTSHDSMTLVMTGADTSHNRIVGVATEALKDEAKYLDLVVHGEV